MSILSNLFGGGRNQKVQAMIAAGAVVIDVRSPQEFKGGHFKGSKNIPLDRIQTEAQKIKALDKPVVVCCASGMRSSQAKSILLNQGVKVVENGGGWTSL